MHLITGILEEEGRPEHKPSALPRAAELALVKKPTCAGSTPRPCAAASGEEGEACNEVAVPCGKANQAVPTPLHAPSRTVLGIDLSGIVPEGSCSDLVRRMTSW
jgi:hypothetical protein